MTCAERAGRSRHLEDEREEQPEDSDKHALRGRVSRPRAHEGVGDKRNEQGEQYAAQNKTEAPAERRDEHRLTQSAVGYCKAENQQPGQ